MKNWRENLVFIFILILTVVLISRLFFLQIIKGNYYKALSFGMHTSLVEEGIRRGEIFFAGGEPLATNRENFFVFAIPNKITEKEKTAQMLSEALNLEKISILKTLKKDNNFAIIKENLTDEEIERLKKLNLSNVFIDVKIERFYPQKELASKIVGFVDVDGNGRYGLEGFYDSLLKKGENLFLTLDYRLQYFAERLLEKAYERFNIEGGQIIVAEPNSCKILAFANFPNFDPNRYKEFSKNLEVFKNPGTQNLFEPGSVLKPITIAIGLEEGKISTETTYRDPGEIKIDGWVIRNYMNRVYSGEISMTEVLEKSINTGAVFVQSKIEGGTFLNYLKSFGFFEKSGIDLPESFSENLELRKKRPINLATASFGQGIAITPVQLLRAYCTIANGGILVSPYLVEKFKKEGSKVILSKNTIFQLNSMLVSVVENGFSKKAKIPGYYIGGKTGTAQQPNVNFKGYSDKTWQTFVGYLPAFNPQIVILVKLDNPNTKTAEYSALPIFREMAEYIIRVYQIVPDYPIPD